MGPFPLVVCVKMYLKINFCFNYKLHVICLCYSRQGVANQRLLTTSTFSYINVTSLFSYQILFSCYFVNNNHFLTKIFQQHINIIKLNRFLSTCMPSFLPCGLNFSYIIISTKWFSNRIDNSYIILHQEINIILRAHIFSL